MPTVLITGGSGLIGSHLTSILIAKGYYVIVLSRSKKKSERNNLSFAQWDVKQQIIDEGAVSKADYIIHLAGAGVADERWTIERKKEIVHSRTLSSATLVHALQQIPNNIKAVISASAIGFYGDDVRLPNGKEAFEEDMPPDESFLGDTCRLWEESIAPVKDAGIRLVKLRIGIVLSNKGGAYPEFKKPVKFGIAAMLGSGKQVISWIHIDDLCRMIVFAMEQPQLSGTFNAVAPNPVRNKELTITLAEAMRGNFYIPVHVPAFALKVMLGEMSIEVLKSATVSAKKISNAGFMFTYPTIEKTIENLSTSNV